jgi:sterol desaturase/sphingolipid hydroxylase (fatty acid hydroxylase superfamily)
MVRENRKRPITIQALLSLAEIIILCCFLVEIILVWWLRKRKWKIFLTTQPRPMSNDDKNPKL